MLSDLSIRNVVLIEALDLELCNGLTALTGETGAGKSIILDALGMATGARSDKGLVRRGSANAQCTASFDLPVDHPSWTLLSDAGIDVEPGEPLVLRRMVNADGRSKAFANDTPIGVKLLSSVGDTLLEVHGQHDGRGLLNASHHIHLLDAFGGHIAELNTCSEAYQAFKEAEQFLADLQSRANQSDEDRDFLTHAIDELDRLDPQAGEEISLSAARQFLQGAEGALAELSAAEIALGSDDAFENRLASALAGIERVKTKLGEIDHPASGALDQAAVALEKALLETQEARQAVAQAAQAFDLDPKELERVEERLFALKAASRKYGVDIADLMVKRRALAEEVHAIENIGAALAQAQKDRDAAIASYEQAAKTLSGARQRAADRLDLGVHKELPGLKMDRAIFQTVLSEAPPSSLGIDKVRFQVATNVGTGLGPLDKIASGGELARFSLAIKVALANETGRVMIFDEVDQGVGGSVAAAVGQRLGQLAQRAQVLVVTHSPQVAASADHQFSISKSTDGDTTHTHVQPVTDEDREEEIARMLAGETITQEARAAARQLMKAS